MAEPTLIERLARYLATIAEDGVVGPWQDHIERAATVIALLKEPDPAMECAGDGQVWRAMVDAALRDRWTLEAALLGKAEPSPAGADEEGEVHLAPSDIHDNERASWVTIGRKDR